MARILSSETELVLAINAWLARPSEQARRDRMRLAADAVEGDGITREVAWAHLTTAAQRGAAAPASHLGLVQGGLRECLALCERDRPNLLTWQQRMEIGEEKVA